LMAQRQAKAQRFVDDILQTAVLASSLPASHS
jgi:hypothetical protein